MTRQLVLVHGRAQQNKDPDELKQEWLSSLRKGLQKNGLQIPIAEDDIRFPYYGDTLDQLNQGQSLEDAAKIVVKGPGDGTDEETEFIRSVILEIAEHRGIADEQIREHAADVQELGVVEKGVLNWGWVQSILEVMDKRIPGASSASVALATRDVHRYLTHPVIRQKIDDGVSEAITPGVETVVVGHSLGSVVAYNILKERGHRIGWTIPHYITVGSPLAVTSIKQKIAPRKHPECVEKWFNAMDQRDVVSLFPLDQQNFSVTPPIENKTDVDNHTENRHGIAGYLCDPVVAKKIYDALIA